MLDIDHGVIAQPYRRLLSASLRRYPANVVLTDLAARHGMREVDWLVVPLVRPGYLQLWGPGGRRFSVPDVRVQQSVGEVAAGVVERYPRELLPGGDRPTVLDRVGLARADVRLAERTFEQSALTVVQLTAGESSATLELHSGFFTCYWKTRLDALRFVHEIMPRQDAAYASVTLADESGRVEQVPAAESAGIVDRVQEITIGSRWSVIRFDGPEISWVWQHGPGETIGEPSADQGAFYAGCASTANLKANFQAASELLRETAVDGDRIFATVHLLEHYLDRWESLTW